MLRRLSRVFTLSLVLLLCPSLGLAPDMEECSYLGTVNCGYSGGCGNGCPADGLLYSCAGSGWMGLISVAGACCTCT